LRDIASTRRRATPRLHATSSIDEHKQCSERDLSAKSYVYVWADGVYLQARLEDEAQCILVTIGATPILCD
jgi:transposase-like protein